MQQESSKHADQGLRCKASQPPALRPFHWAVFRHFPSFSATRPRSNCHRSPPPRLFPQAHRIRTSDTSPLGCQPARQPPWRWLISARLRDLPSRRERAGGWSGPQPHLRARASIAFRQTQWRRAPPDGRDLPRCRRSLTRRAGPTPANPGSTERTPRSGTDRALCIGVPPKSALRGRRLRQRSRTGETLSLRRQGTWLPCTRRDLCRFDTMSVPNRDWCD